MITLVYVHLPAELHLESVSPALIVSLHERYVHRNGQDAHSLLRYPPF